MAAVKPIESFGASSQRALEHFHLNFNTALASQPRTWADRMSNVLAGSSLKDTIPVVLEDTKWREVAKGINTDAVTTLVKDVEIKKRKFAKAARAELVRLQRGDHAYVQSWAQKPAAHARGRQFLRNHLVGDLLAAGESTTCFDGGNFFATNHPVNPFDSSIQFRSSSTWSNYQSSATPLNASNLTQEKQAAEQGVPGPDGEEMGLEFNLILHPSSLNTTAYNLLSVQDLILEGALSGGGDGTMGTVRNPHFQSGKSSLRAPELPGADTTADWYLVSEEALAMMMPPMIIVEEDLPAKRWDETSDYYKDSDHIKIQEEALLEAAFLFPHGIRKIKGS